MKLGEYQELIEGTESTVASLKNSIIETAVKTAGIIAEIKNLKLYLIQLLNPRTFAHTNQYL